MLKKAVSEAAADGSTGGVAPVYVEDAFEVRTKPGRRRVSARQGWVGENSDFFSIPLAEGEGNGRKSKNKHRKCNPSNNDASSAQRHVEIMHRRMSKTPQTRHERPQPPTGPSDISQHDEDGNHDKGHRALVSTPQGIGDMSSVELADGKEI